MKILKWFAILLIYIILVLTIKNIEIILPILFQYREIIQVMISYLFVIVIVILQCLIKCNDTADNDKN